MIRRLKAIRIAISLASLGAAPLWAQTDMQHGGHSEHRGEAEPTATDAGAMHAGHGDMRMQGGEAPTDARDPHAYSGGYTLTEGPYARPGPRELKLADEHRFWSVLGDRFEYIPDGDVGELDLQGWYGGTYDRFTTKFEGEIADNRLEESQTELLWTHAVDAYFDTQLGLRFDQYDEGPDRQWLALGLQGLAPYWFELDATAYLGESGRTALSVEAEYELLLTQRLVLQPRVELNFYGKDDPENGLGEGLSDAAAGLRLRYEISRQFAPYVGVEWTGTFGDTADFARAAGKATRDTRVVAGIRFWF